MKGTFAALLAGTSVLAIRVVCGLKVHVAPNGNPLLHCQQHTELQKEFFLHHFRASGGP